MSNPTSEGIVGGLPAPPGVTPNFVDPYSLQRGVVSAVVVCLAISTFCVWTRMYTKLCITRSHGWDDYACLVAWLGLVAFCTIIVDNNHYGNGRHQWNVPMQDLVPFAKLVNYQEVIYGPILFLTKLSILLQYLRLFVPTHKGTTYWLIQCNIWLNLLFYVLFCLLSALACVPRRKIWEPSTPGHCVNEKLFLILTAAFNIVSDFCILLLPLGKIWRLQMPVRRKVGVSAVFAAGLFACISSTMRLVVSITFVRTADETYSLVPVGLWAIAEITSGISCGCLPVLPQFFRHFGPAVTNRLSFSPHGKSQGTSSTKCSSISKPAKARAPTHDTWGSTLNNSYIELDERDESRILSGNLTTVKGGMRRPSDWSEDVGDYKTHEFRDLESGAPQIGIRKTVRVETSDISKGGLDVENSGK